MFGFVALAPASPAHAAGPAITLTNTSGSAITSAQYGSQVVISGTGFTPNVYITIKVNGTQVAAPSQYLSVPTSTFSQLPTGPAIFIGADSLFTTTGGLNSPVSDSDGNFMTTVEILYLVNGPTTVTATDSSNQVAATATLTINAYVTFDFLSVSNGFPEQAVPVILDAYGFASGETVSFTSTAFNSNAPFGLSSSIANCTAGGVGTYAGYCTSNNSYATVNTVTGSGALFVADTSGGQKAIVASGQTSGATGIVNFLVKPWVSFYNNQGSSTTFSLSATSPTSVLVEGHGFPAGTTISGNSATISGIATNHAAITVNQDGTFGAGAGNHVVMSATSTLPLGNAPFVLNGVTFAWNALADNIVLAMPLGIQTGGALIASVVGTTGTGTSVGSLSSQTVQPGITAEHTGAAASEIAVYGYGFVPQTSGGGLVTVNVSTPGTSTSVEYFPLSLIYNSIPTYAYQSAGDQAGGYADANGAFLATLGIAEAPSVSSGSTVTPYTVTIAQTGGTGNPLNPTFNIQPWIDFSGGAASPFVSLTMTGGVTLAQSINAAGTNFKASCTVAGCGNVNTANPSASAKVAPILVYQSTLNGVPAVSPGGYAAVGNMENNPVSTLAFHGFTNTQTITLTYPDTTISPVTTVGPVTSSGTYTYTLPTVTFTLAKGSYAVTAKDSASVAAYASASNAVKIITSINTDAMYANTGSSALTSTAGQPTSTTVLRTGSDSTTSLFGVRGLAANTAYTVTFGYVGTPTSVGTFTTDQYGRIPVPGMTITVPTGTAGLHAIAIWQGTTNVISANLASWLTLNTLSFNIGGTASGVDTVPSNAATTSVSAACGGTGDKCVSMFGDALYSLTVNISPSPSAGYVAQTVVLSGVGLAPSTAYYATLTSTTGAAGATGQVYFTFTTSAAGTIPSGTSFNVPNIAAVGAAYTNERASTYYIHFSTGSEYPGGQDGQSTFVLQANAVMNSTSAPVGHAVTLSATGLVAATPYSVVFNYAVASNGNTFTGPVVGSLTTDTNGQGSSTFVVPAGTQSGSYVIQLVTPGATAPTAAWLVNPPTLSVSQGGGNNTSCNTTSCFGLSGTVTQTTVGSYPAVSASYTNNSNAPVTAVVFAVVHNSIGQTVDISTATLGPLASGASGTATPVLFGLASGTYSVTVFVTTSNGVAISTTSTVSVSL